MKPAEGDRICAAELTPSVPACEPQFRPDMILTVLALFMVFRCGLAMCGGYGATRSAPSLFEDGDDGAGETSSAEVPLMLISSM